MKLDSVPFTISRRDALIVFFTLLVLVGAFIVFDNLSVPFARTWDIRFGYYATLSAFLLLVAGIVCNAKDIIIRIRGHRPSGKSLCALACLLVFFSAFSLNHIGNSHRVLSDETSWESMGLQMHFAKTGGICNEGIWTDDGRLDCKVEVNNFKGKSLGFLYSLVFKFAQPNRDTALLVNFPLYLLSLLAFFLALSIWFRNDWLALAATAFLGGMPIYLMQARSASTEVLYIALLSLLMAHFALVPGKEVKWKHFLITVPLLGLFAGTRQETVFAFIPFALYYYRYFRERAYRLPLFAIAVIAVSWPAVNTMAAYRGYDFQGGTHAAHSLANLGYNLKTNLGVMLNFEEDPSFGGILENPFYSSFTILLLLSTAWLLYRMVAKKRYRRGFLLGILFSVQIFVILLNVSGTFEIDINQRYVLVALPLFAMIMALGLADFLETCRLGKIRACGITAAVAIVLAVGLAEIHATSFESNMLYYKNKLLGEEDFLNTYLENFPKGSVFIYARPWQMLASGHSSFSERSFMGWTTDEFSKYKNESGDNLYLVRGQDGYGQVNRDSRVVGFKTTEQVSTILEGYRVKEILSEKRLFGYPLTVHRILSKHGISAYVLGISVDEFEKGAFRIRKSFPESAAYELSLGDSLLFRGTLDSAETPVTVGDLPEGLHRYRFSIFVPDDTIRISRDVFVPGDGFALLSEMPIDSYEQAWGDPQKNESVEHHALKLGGESYRYGIGSHAKSILRYRLPAAFGSFRAVVGLDEESACGDGAEFAIALDGKEIWRSKRLYSGDAMPVQVNLVPAKFFELRLDAGENNGCDHGDWANAWFSDASK